VCTLNRYYQAKEFEYRVTGAKSYPTVEDLIRLADALLKCTRTTCAKSVGAA